jgi:hypothetical protein
MIDPVERAAEITRDAYRTRSRMAELVDQCGWGQAPDPAARGEYDALAAHLKDLAKETGHLILREHALEMALRERLGVVDVEGQTITAADEARADELLALYRIGGA